MPASTMTKLWSGVATFNVLFLLNLWWLDRANTAPIDVFTPDPRPEVAPIFVLTLGTWTTIISLAILHRIVRLGKQNGRRTWDLLPVIWADVGDDREFGRLLKVVTVIACVAFPLAAQLHFWRQLHDGEAWTNQAEDTGTPVGIWQPVPLAHVVDWDAYRYGEYAERETSGGVSFLPFWQPLIMALTSAGLVALTLHLGLLVFSPCRRPADGRLHPHDP